MRSYQPRSQHSFSSSQALRSLPFLLLPTSNTSPSKNLALSLSFFLQLCLYFFFCRLLPSSSLSLVLGPLPLSCFLSSSITFNSHHLFLSFNSLFFSQPSSVTFSLSSFSPLVPSLSLFSFVFFRCQLSFPLSLPFPSVSSAFFSHLHSRSLSLSTSLLFLSILGCLPPKVFFSPLVFSVPAFLSSVIPFPFILAFSSLSPASKTIYKIFEYKFKW